MLRKYAYLPAVTATAIVGSCAFLTAAGYAADNPPFTIPKISSFDGKTWGDIALGVTTQDGIKKAFRNSRGDYNASVEVIPAEMRPYKVSALYPSKDKSAVLQGIVVRYRTPNDGFPLDKVTELLGGVGDVYFSQTDRYEDWTVIAYPNRGIVLFVLADKVNIILFGYPERIPATLTPLTTTPSNIAPLESHFAGRIPELVFGSTSVNFTMDSKRIHLRDQDREQNRLAADMTGRALPGLRYQPGASGTFSIQVSVDYNKDKGGTGTINASIDGDAKYGHLQTSLSRTFPIDAGMDFVPLETTDYYRTLGKAIRDVENDAAIKAQTQVPPPVESLRYAVWDRIVDTYRNHSDPKTITPPTHDSLLN